MLRFVEMTLVVIATVILTGTNAYYHLFGIPAEITVEELLQYGGQIRNVFMLAYIIVMVLAVLNWEKMLLGMAAVWPIMLLLVIAWLSNFWTVAPEFTYRRDIALTVTTLMGIYLFSRYDLDTLLRILTVVVAILVIGSLIWVVAVPDYGVHSDAEHAGAWRGIFFHKNTTGRVMVFSLAVIIAAWSGNCVNRLALAVLGGLTLLVILGTTSQTALLGTVILVPGLITIRMVRGHALKSALVTLVVLAIAWHGALIGIANYDLILEALGRDPSLTGRTEIWLYALDYAFQRPFTGYGYAAFWNGELSPGAQYSAYWGTPHSHNGWLEVFIALGLPAVLIMMGIVIVTVLRAIILARYYPTTTPAILIMLTSFSMLTIAMSEPVFLEQHSFDWILMVIVIGCARALTSNLKHTEQPLATEGRDSPGMLRRSPT